MTALLDRAQNRAIQLQLAGFTHTRIIATGDGLPRIGCRAPCNAAHEIELAGPIPRCANNCGCPADARRRAKEKFGA